MGHPHDGKEVFAKTVYAESCGEGEAGWHAVGCVIRNRANKDKPYWGGSRIRSVCLHPGQFECWDGKNDIYIGDENIYAKIKEITDGIYNGSDHYDSTDGADHYHNPDKPREMEKSKEWRKNCNFVKRIGNHDFYKTKPGHR